MGSGKPNIKEAKPKEEGKEKKKEAKPEKKVSQKPIIKNIEGVKGIVRFCEADLIGSKKVKMALLEVKGIGHTLSKSIQFVSKIDPNKMVGALSDEEMKMIEDIAKNPTKYGIPGYLVNRQKHPETGISVHNLSSDLKLAVKNDIDTMKKMQCYKGVRHQLGLPVRGQRTRSSFRTGAKVGVSKVKQKPAEKGPSGAPSAKTIADAKAAKK